MFIWNGENIDRYFCNEEMAFANRSHPVPDVGTCLAFKGLNTPFGLKLKFYPGFWQKFSNRGESDQKKRLLVLLFDLHLHFKAVGKLARKMRKSDIIQSHDKAA